MATIGLDIGTTGCKATAVDERGATLSQRYREYDLSLPWPGWVELNPLTVWESVKDVVSGAAAACPQAITSLAVASFGEAAVLLDERGAVAADSIFFTDSRGYDYVETLTNDLGRERVEARTGMPVNGMYTLLKLLWLREHERELFRRVRTLLPFGSYINYRLTGRAACDESLASRTLLFDRTRREWDEELLRYGGLTRERMPELVPAGAPVGTVVPAVAAELGLSADTLVVSGCHDQVAAALGAGAIRPGEAADGIGSAECITAVLPEDADLSVLFPNNICAEPYAAGGRSVALVFNNTAGAALKWYRDTFERELRDRCRETGDSAYRILDGGMSAQPSPLLFLPYLSGTGTPYMDSRATGMLCGLTLGSGRPDIYRAILEGLNYEMRYNLELLGRSGLRLDSLTAVGGGASSRAALQIKADILRMPIRTLENPQSGNLGLAMLCAVAEGRYTTLEQAMEDLIKVKEVITPDDRHAPQYEASYARYTRLYEAARRIDAADG